MELNAVDVAEVVELVWSTTLNLEIQRESPGERDWPRGAIEAQVHIAGAWQGAVVLHAAPGLAARIARIMFELGEEQPGSEEIQDAFGEVANITGGNIKGLLSESGAHLSLPAVVQGTDYSVRIPGARILGRFTFSCDGEPLLVTVLEAEEPNPAEAAKNSNAASRAAC